LTRCQCCLDFSSRDVDGSFFTLHTRNFPQD
jgi:hypothetical protein